MNRSLYMAYSASDQNLLSAENRNNNLVNGDPGDEIEPAPVPPRSQSANQIDRGDPELQARATVTFTQQVYWFQSFESSVSLYAFYSIFALSDFYRFYLISFENKYFKFCSPKNLKIGFFKTESLSLKKSVPQSLFCAETVKYLFSASDNLLPLFPSSVAKRQIRGRILRLIYRRASYHRSNHARFEGTDGLWPRLPYQKETVRFRNVARTLCQISTHLGGTASDEGWIQG